MLMGTEIPHRYALSGWQGRVSELPPLRSSLFEKRDSFVFVKALCSFNFVESAFARFVCKWTSTHSLTRRFVLMSKKILRSFLRYAPSGWQANEKDATATLFQGNNCPRTYHFERSEKSHRVTICPYKCTRQLQNSGHPQEMPLHVKQ